MLVKGKGCETEKVSVLGQSVELEVGQGYGLQFELMVLYGLIVGLLECQNRLYGLAHL